METSQQHVLTTHTGSLPRPSWLQPEASAGELARAVQEVAEQQRTAGISVLNDGEVGKVSYATYVVDRLTGFGDVVEEPFLGRDRADLRDYPRYRERLGASVNRSIGVQPYCVGDVRYVGQELLAAELDRLAEATTGGGQTDVFCTAASPGVIARWMPNRHYDSEEAYLYALAEAMRTEYEAVAAAGFVLQLDCPDLTTGWHSTDGDIAAQRRMIAERLGALDYATSNISPDRMRLHLCWGNYQGPHHHDLPIAAFIDLVLASRPVGLSFEAANPRHEHEWTVFADRKVPDDTILIPGVIDSTTNYIEHPELVAQRICRYAEAVGAGRVIAGTDCGFATFAGNQEVDPDIAWAKLEALAEGSQIASQRIWA